MNKLESVLKKLKNVNIKGVLKGRHNMTTGLADEVAEIRAEVCKTCPHNVEEPIPELRIKDEVLPHISERCCGVCGCSLPYLTRQFEETCKLKKWDI
jgi:hypothetical protein